MEKDIILRYKHYLDKMNEGTVDPPYVKPQDVKNMEDRYEEWCIDVADISLVLGGEYVNDQTIKELFNKMMEEKYPHIVEKSITERPDWMDGDESLDYFVHHLKLEELISEDEYYRIMSDTYNLTEKTKRCFWVAFQKGGCILGLDDRKKD